MDQELFRLLNRVDDPEECEAPAEFDLEAEVNAVRNLILPLNELVGRDFVLNDRIEDAPFFAELSIIDWTTNPSGGKDGNGIISLRFSAFGRLFIVWSPCPQYKKLDPRVIEQVIDLVRRSGYVYVDAEALVEPYEGGNPALKGRYTWWGRYFDWF
ncbi:MAG TPA: hypothetical protein VJB14_11810 [Planctomycetota bacterium]|nr:hypothetical protein [Planctomycetota bacterium]